jgi:CBS domain-containing protein
MLKAVRLGESVSEMHDILVSDVINHRPYMVDVSDPLPQILRAMADKHIGSVLVLKEGEVVGIFTTNDALRRLAQNLEDAFPANDPNDDAA